MYNLARIYKSKNKIFQNINQVIYWYEKAANNGHLPAMHNLGIMYKNGMVLRKIIIKLLNYLNSQMMLVE